MPQQRLRRSLLYVPGNMPSLLQNILAFQCDVCIIDLEDAVPRTEKDAASLHIDRPKSGEHLLVPRQLLLMACRVAGLQAIDTVWADTTDMDGFRAECEHIKVLGFDGKSLINPRQIDILHEVMAPKPEEVDYALQVVDAIVKAREQGTGVVSLGGKMIDAPVVARAVRMLLAAKSQGMVETDIDESVIYGKE